MKNLLTACIVLMASVALLQAIPDVDLVPEGVRAVLDDAGSIWSH